jgi:four helix bundle protein
MAQGFEELLVWQKAMEMTVAVYEVTRQFPREEVYGLTSQMRRSSVSVASNIAEGRGRLTEGEFRQFLGAAQGSNYELHTQLMVARRLNFGNAELLSHAEGLSREVAKMLAGLIATVGKKSFGKSKES